MGWGGLMVSSRPRVSRVCPARLRRIEEFARRLSALALEWIFELREVAFWDGVAADAVTFRPTILGQIVGAKKAVEERKVHGEIDVDGFALEAVVPVMKAWRDEDALDEREAPIEVCVHERRVE